MSTPVTLTGRLTAAADLKFSNSGKPIAKFTVVTSGRRLNKETDKWEDTDTTFWRCTAFSQLAENIAEHLDKGSAVILSGTASQEDWLDKDGNKRMSLKVIVNNLGEDLRWRKTAGQARTRAEDYDEDPPFLCLGYDSLMQIISVSAGEFTLSTLLDDEVYARLGGRKLSLGSHGYTQMWDGKRVALLHRWIMGAQVGDGRLIDHCNGDVLDNQKSNLRFVTPGESSSNVRARGLSGIRGVYLTPSGRWHVKGKSMGQQYHLGTYDTIEEAAEVAHCWRRDNLPGFENDYDRDPIGGFRDRRTWVERQERRLYALEVRAWAAARGMMLSEHGRIPRAIVTAYEESRPSG